MSVKQEFLPKVTKQRIGEVVQTRTSRPPCTIIRRITASIKLKIAVFAPIPSARDNRGRSEHGGSCQQANAVAAVAQESSTTGSWLDRAPLRPPGNAS
jgi:hypothetical protein